MANPHPFHFDLKRVNKILYSKSIEIFLNNIKECQLLYCLNYTRVNEKDKETQDLLHQIEMDSNSKNRNKAATALRKVRLQRRESKDIVERTKLIVDFATENKIIFDKMAYLLGAVRKAESSQINRHYNAKIRKDLTISKARG